MPRGLTLVAMVALLAACTPGSAASDRPPSASAIASPAASSGGSGVPIGQAGNVDVETLRRALLGEPPYPSGWEAQVDELVATVREALDGLRVPDVAGMGPVDAACAVWTPLIGHTDWANGAFVERQFFVAHVASLASVAPDPVRQAATEAFRISAAAAAEQVKPDGDPTVVSRAPREAIRTIGLWAVEHCELPIVADSPPDTEGWTAEEIEQSCTWDRDWLTDAQEDYRQGPGMGSYAEHPHQLEVTLEVLVYPAWHRLARVDNAADPPAFDVEPIPGSFCDR